MTHLATDRFSTHLHPPAESISRLLSVLSLALFFCACSGESEPTPTPVSDTLALPGATLTLGDIDPIEPARRIRRLQPIADLLAERLADLGYGSGRVQVARDIDEMADLMLRGEVDLLFDSTYPALAIREKAGGRVLLRRWARDEAEYWTVFVAPLEGGATNLAELPGQVVVFQEPHSTSGFFLPAANLLSRGLTLDLVHSLAARPAPGTVGVFFSGDEENTVQLLARAAVVAGVLSNQDLSDLPTEMRAKLAEIGRTVSVPRQVVLARPGLDSDLADRIVTVLLTLTDDDRAALRALDPGQSWTWRFDDLPDEDRQVLEELASSLDDVERLMRASGR